MLEKPFSSSTLLEVIEGHVNVQSIDIGFVLDLC